MIYLVRIASLLYSGSPSREIFNSVSCTLYGSTCCRVDSEYRDLMQTPLPLVTVSYYTYIHPFPEIVSMKHRTGGGVLRPSGPLEVCSLLLVHLMLFGDDTARIYIAGNLLIVMHIHPGTDGLRSPLAPHFALMELSI